VELSHPWRTAIRFAAVLLAATALALSPALEAKGKSGSHSHSSHSGGSWKAQGVSRDSHGKIARSSSAKSSFKKQQPCPSTGRSSGACPGYVIDHVRPLKRGGADSPGNMQWQTIQAAKAKDKWE